MLGNHKGGLQSNANAVEEISGNQIFLKVIREEPLSRWPQHVGWDTRARTRTDGPVSPDLCETPNCSRHNFCSAFMQQAQLLLSFCAAG